MAARRRAGALLALALLLALVPASAAFAAEFDVDIVAFEYIPPEVDVAVGDTVTWTNMDPEPHTVTSLPDATEQFDATLQQGETFSYTFAEDGFNPYFCTIHPDMQGDVLVGDAERPEPLDTTPLTADDATGASIAYSQRAFGEGLAGGTALIGRDDLFADSLSSGGLQGALDAPLLLTDGAELDQRVTGELARLAVATVWILGGEQAISAGVAGALEAAGYEVDRIEGATRIETAVDAAMTVLPEATGAVLARAYAAGDDATQAFADSLGAGALAAATGQPVLLSETAALSSPTAAYLASSTVETVTVIGGEEALSAQVVADLEALGLEVERLGGSNRVETAAAVAAATAFAQGPLPEAAVVIDGQADLAWAAGFPAAVLRLPIVLASGEDLPPPSAAFMIQLGSLGMPPLCGPFLSSTPCGYAGVAASTPVFPGGDVLLAVLEGQNEVNDAGEGDQGDLDATGAATVFPTSSDTALCYDYTAMLEVAASHIHAAPAGEVGEIVLPLEVAPGPFGLPAGCTFDVAADLVADILADPASYYVNLHTEEFPAGAIRGQLFAPQFMAVAELSGDQEVPGPGDMGEEAGGFGGVVGKSDTELCSFLFLGPLSSPVTAAHIHEAPAGEAGPIVQPLRTPVAPGETYSCYTADEALVTELQTNAEAYYINVHTEALPDGAIRGQLGNFQ